MHLRTPLERGLSQWIRLSRSIRPKRQLHSRSTGRDASPAEQTGSKSSKKVTKITYKDLVDKNLRGSGQRVPLPSWDGGLGEPYTNHELVDFKSVPGETQHTTSQPVSPAIPKRRARASRSLKQARDGAPALEAKPAKRSLKSVAKGTSVTEAEQGPRNAHPSVSKLNDELESPSETPTTMSARRPRNQLAVEILDNLQKFAGSILLTRVGQFYESYFDQAQEVAGLLSIKLTKRTWGGQRIWMCGFPLMHLDKHLKILVQVHKRSVALCEEFPKPRSVGVDDALSKPTFERRVVRVLTPGTLIDESFLNPYENNYLLAISASTETSSESMTLGLAWIDVSTGEFFSRETPLGGLADHLARISPKEVVLDSRFQTANDHPIYAFLVEEKVVISFAMPIVDTPVSSLNTREGTMDNVIDGQPLTAAPESTYKELEGSAISLLTTFLRASLMEHMPSSLVLSREQGEERMQIDAQTVKSLEIREGLREGGTTGSLMSAIKRTVTNGGTRLLARWLCAPSTSLDEVNARLSLVEYFIRRPALRDDVTEQLRALEDSVRILQRFLLGRGEISDLLTVKSAIDIWGNVKERIMLERRMEQLESGSIDAQSWSSIDTLMRRLTTLEGLAHRIGVAIEDTRVQRKAASISMVREAGDGESEALGSPETIGAADPTALLMTSRLQWSIRPDFSLKLAELHNKIQKLQAEKERLESEFRKEYDASSLTLRSSPNHGMHVHVAKPRRDAARLNESEAFVLLAESASTRVYFNQAWFSLGNSIFETTLAITLAEREAFASLRNEVNAEATAIRRNARVFDELDVTSSFANLATELNFVKPILADEFFIVNGRHPTVELGLLNCGRNFVSNTLGLDDNNRLQIITGPNMAGKSTFLRQNALIAILAQAGSFVPASHAEIGIVDRVFSRVGAKDDLFRNRSTFMVEMLETADILNRATPRSLVIMDEVGRGTTVTDGLAIAFATLHHLYHVNTCRALFATHFHEVVDMLGYTEGTRKSDTFPNVSFSCTDVHESEDGRFVYSHRMRPGVNRDSHGLKVAQLAGLPSLALDVAADARHWIANQSQQWMGNKEELVAYGRGLAKIHTRP